VELDVHVEEKGLGSVCGYSDEVWVGVGGVLDGMWK